MALPVKWRFHDEGVQTFSQITKLTFFFGYFSACSWRVLDLSVAMAYAMLTSYGKNNRGISAAAALLRGYNSVCPLSTEERKHLVLLIACRLSCSVTLGAYSYDKNPENEYLLLHATPGWNALDLIWGDDPVKRLKMRVIIESVFDQACAAEVNPNADAIDCSDLSFPDPDVVDPLADVRASCEDEADRPEKRQRNMH